MKEWGTVTERILAALEEVGPMTNAEICSHLQLDKCAVGAVVSRLSKASVRKPKRIYITHYVHDSEGARRYPRGVYALGDQPDARKPKSSTKEIKARYWAKKKLRMKANSVFHLGMSRDALRNMYKQIKEKKCST